MLYGPTDLVALQSSWMRGPIVGRGPMVFHPLEEAWVRRLCLRGAGLWAAGVTIGCGASAKSGDVCGPGTVVEGNVCVPALSDAAISDVAMVDSTASDGGQADALAEGPAGQADAPAEGPGRVDASSSNAAVADASTPDAGTDADSGSQREGAIDASGDGDATIVEASVPDANSDGDLGMRDALSDSGADAGAMSEDGDTVPYTIGPTPTCGTGPGHLAGSPRRKVARYRHRAVQHAYLRVRRGRELHR